MNYTDFLIQKYEKQSAKELAKEYKIGQLLIKSKNTGDRMIGVSYLSAIGWVLKMKDMMFMRNFHTYKKVWYE